MDDSPIQSEWRPTRRQALATLAVCGGAVPARGTTSWQSYFNSSLGVGVALDVKTGAILAAHRLKEAATLSAPPGSTIKPFSLLALLQSGKLKTQDTHPCSGSLRIATASYNCSHPKSASPIDLPGAIAYSCNEYVAYSAARFAPGELASSLQRYGLGSRTGLVQDASEATGRIGRAAGAERNQLQALGENQIEVTVLQLAMAYRRLALDSARVDMSPILAGLEGAVAFGTAQRAQVPGVTVAGKTGSAARQFAWFAGFAPSRAPRIVVAVMVQGRAGGADAAPIAGKVLAAYFEGKL